MLDIFGWFLFSMFWSVRTPAQAALPVPAVLALNAWPGYALTRDTVVWGGVARLGRAGLLSRVTL